MGSSPGGNGFRCSVACDSDSKQVVLYLPPHRGCLEFVLQRHTIIPILWVARDMFHVSADRPILLSRVQRLELIS